MTTLHIKIKEFTKTKKYKIHAIAMCNDCQWREEYQELAEKKALKHAKETLHEVAVEIGTFYYLNKK